MTPTAILYQGHHGSNARRALDDFVAFDEAVGVGLEKTSSDDTLIVVTADHSHEFYFGGKYSFKLLSRLIGDRLMACRILKGMLRGEIRS